MTLAYLSATYSKMSNGFYMPFSCGLNPHLDEGRQTSKEWAYEMGMLGIPGISFWDEQKFDVIDAALVCALMYPKASNVVYELTTKSLVWGFYIEGYFDARYLSTRDIAGGRLFLTRLLAIVSSDSIPIVMPTNPSERGLVDLWQRMAASMSADTKQQMRYAIVEILESWLWQLANQVQNRIPDPIDYIEMRLKTFGFDFMMILNHSDKTPPEVYEAQPMRSLYRAAGDVVALTNDIVSYQKEMESEGILLNGVLVTQHFLDCDSTQAVEIVNNLIAARVCEFEHIVANELPALCEDFDLDTSNREKLFGYVEQLQFIMSGLLKWHLGTTYYQESEFGRDPSPRNLFNIPQELGFSAPAEPEKQLIGVLNGLGTSAAQIRPKVNQKKTQTNVHPIVQKLLRGPTGLGTSAIEIGSSSVPQEITEPTLEPIVQNLLTGSTGLGTSATEISSSAVSEETTEPALEPMAREVVSSLTKLGTATMHIRSLLGTKS